MRQFKFTSSARSLVATGCGAAGELRRPAKRRWQRPRLAALIAVWLLGGCCVLTARAQSKDSAAQNTQPAGQDAAGVLDPAWAVGPWIWAATTHDKQTCRFWRSFEIPPGATVARAQLRISVDNGYRLLLDGRELGTGSDWRSITEYDIALLLKPGRHVVAVQGFNDNREAGMQFGLKIETTDGQMIEIPSDPSWRLVPTEERGWESRRDASEDWGRAVVANALLSRSNGWQERKPTMIVKVPILLPVELHFWQRGSFQVLLFSVVIAAVLGCLRLMAKLAVQSRAQAMLQRERARIARDIHDELGARLTELALEGEVAQTELPAGSEAHARFAAFSEKARALSGAMDEVVWMVNSRRDTLRDFATYACKHARRFLEPTPIRCRLDVEADLPEVTFELPVRRNLLLAVKEALNNAAKYSGATELFLRVHRIGKTVRVVVEDNGRGFDPELADPARNGLTNMAQRMQEIGGECRIVSKAGAGCRVEFQVPLPNASRQADQSAMGLPEAQEVSPATPAAREVST